MAEDTKELWRCLPASYAHECDAGRWLILPPVVRGDDHTTPRIIAEIPASPLAERDAADIVACVNAFAGLKPEKVQALVEFVDCVAGGPHSELCPLNHPAYRNKWCHTCEAKKLLAEVKSDE